MSSNRLSALERRVVEVALGEPELSALAAQVQHLVVAERERTGVGIFVHLGHEGEAVPIAPPRRSDPPRALVRHPDMPGDGIAIVWVDESGYIDTIEFVSLDGPWPDDEKVERYSVEPLRVGVPLE